MSTLSPDVTAALATLRTRWGTVAPRLGTTLPGEGSGADAGPLDAGPLDGVGEVVGALATVPLPVDPATPEPRRPHLPVGRPSLDEERVVRTGFAALDAILGPGGVPRSAGLTVRGDASSGKTTLALRLAAEAQAAGSIVAYVDLARSLDPVEAVARGVSLEWLVVLEPASLDEALAMAGALVSSRAVDLLVLDLPPVVRVAVTSRIPGAGANRAPAAAARPTARAPVARSRDGRRPPSVADRLGRLAALARRSEILLVILEPPGLPGPVSTAIAESTGLRLELARRSWIRLGRDIVGQRTEVVVARNRSGPPGRRAELRILYAEGGGRDACLLREPLLTDAPTGPPSGIHDRATPPPPLAPPSPPSRPGASDGRPRLRIVPDRPARPRRPALDGRDGPRREPGGPRARRPAGDAPGVGPPARP
jgi:recombination protein RecA